jgi:hypothetical protein
VLNRLGFPEEAFWQDWAPFPSPFPLKSAEFRNGRYCSLVLGIYNFYVCVAARLQGYVPKLNPPIGLDLETQLL